MTNHEYQAEKIQAKWFEEEDRHISAMKEVVETISLTGDTNQKLSALHLNRDMTDKPPIIKLGAWFNSTTSPEQQYTAYQYAAANPCRSILLVDMPAHGLSDPLTSAQRKEIFSKRQITSVSHSLLTAAQNYMPNLKRFIVNGDSLGGRAAIDFANAAGKKGMEPQFCIGYDIAGIDKRLTVAQAAAYFIGETMLQKKYHEGEANRSLDYEYEKKFKDELKKINISAHSYNPLDVYRNEPFLVGLLFARSPLASGDGLEAIQETMETNPSLRLHLVCAGLSKVTRLSRVRPKLNDLLANYPNFNWEVWPHDSHSMGIAPQQPRFAAHTRDLVTSAEETRMG